MDFLLEILLFDWFFRGRRECKIPWYVNWEEDRVSRELDWNCNFLKCFVFFTKFLLEMILDCPITCSSSFKNISAFPCDSNDCLIRLCVEICRLSYNMESQDEMKLVYLIGLLVGGTIVIVLSLTYAHPNRGIWCIPQFILQLFNVTEHSIHFPSTAYQTRVIKMGTWVMM